MFAIQVQCNDSGYIERVSQHTHTQTYMCICVHMSVISPTSLILCRKQYIRMHVNRFIYAYICHLTSSFNINYVKSSNTHICIYFSTHIGIDPGVSNLYVSKHLPVTSPNLFVLLTCLVRTHRLSFDVTSSCA